MSKIKYTKKVTYEMERYPEKCKECPCFSQKPYSCMNEKGMEARCELGVYGWERHERFLWKYKMFKLYDRRR